MSLKTNVCNRIFFNEKKKISHRELNYILLRVKIQLGRARYVADLTGSNRQISYSKWILASAALDQGTDSPNQVMMHTKKCI